MKDFGKKIPETLINIEEKRRSNLFSWRGQFSPQLIECLMDAYCPPDSIVIDPFGGSGTVLYEAALMSLPAFAFEINPSAWIISKLYEFSNLDLEARDEVISEVRTVIDEEFPIVIFSDDELPIEVLEEKVMHILRSLSDRSKILFNALVVLLDIHNNLVSSNFFQSKFRSLTELIRRLPYSQQQIKADLQDARALPIPNQSVDFAITSPPYINVFNYHQNYRRSVELLGWNLLNVAKSEIGSNRANRGNRFLTVVQYCIDMADALQELARVLSQGGRAVLILGHESRVLETPFYNADIVERIALESLMFEVVLRQQRVFTNRFGSSIREDILNLQKKDYRDGAELANFISRKVAEENLCSALGSVPSKNRTLLLDAISRINEISGTPLFNSLSYANYQEKASVMMVQGSR